MNPPSGITWVKCWWPHPWFGARKLGFNSLYPHNRVWRSLVARTVRIGEAEGSNPSILISECGEIGRRARLRGVWVKLPYGFESRHSHYGVWRSLVSARVWETRGRKFKSFYPDLDTEALLMLQCLDTLPVWLER